MPPSDHRWQQLEPLLDAALDAPPEQRAELLASLTDDAGLRAEALALLEAGESGGSPLERPAAPLAAELFVRSGAPGAAEPPPPRIGPYRLVREIGRGGMGAVFEAEREDPKLRMRVAIKLMRRELGADETLVRRFLEERQILARFEHANIARLLDGGVTDEGRPFYVMEYVAGSAIDRWCDEQRLAVEARLRLFVQTCEAVEYAHRAHVVHRDLKPSNVLVSTTGQVKLVDFGIAKLLRREGGSGATIAHTGLTRTGERMLTPEYASPEQIRGEEVTPATDVYALGMLLFELLAGRRPFQCERRSTHELERAILDEQPMRPSSLVPEEPPDPEAASDKVDVGAARATTRSALRRRLRGDLDAIVLKALRKEPELRYASAEALAEDVRRHLSGRPVRARADDRAYRMRRYVRRHRVSVTAGLVGAGIGGIVLALAFARVDPDAFGRAVAARRAQPGMIGGLSTRSPIAFGFYQEGLRVFTAGNFPEATRLFGLALAEDSSFAMAALYRSRAAFNDEDYGTGREALELAVRFAGHATERERLIIGTYLAQRRRSVEFPFVVESLITRHPNELEGLLSAGQAAMLAGNFPLAIERYREVIRRDAASLAAGQLPCAGCEARDQLIHTLLLADSTRLAREEARQWTEQQPSQAQPWRRLALIELHLLTNDESAFRRAQALDPLSADWAAEWMADLRIRRGDFADADELLRGRIATSPENRSERPLWQLVTSLRNQGRLDEALAAARAYRNLPEHPAFNPGAVSVAAIVEAQVLFEAGRFRESAALFDSVSRAGATLELLVASPSHIAWNLTHSADALAASGDTTALMVLIDSIRALGRQSASGRDQRLHHHVRGLLLAARGDDEGAVREFRSAIYSWTHGFTRTNLELARALMRLRRPGEAVVALQPALRGSMEVSNYYVTHAELREALALAWRDAGNRDSAAVHARWVTAAWRSSDPPFGRRRERMKGLGG